MTITDERTLKHRASVKASVAKKPEYYRAYYKKWREENKEGVAARMREKHLRNTWGLTVEEYDALKAVQGGGCAICGKDETRTVRGEPTRLAVDHNHETGALRGLLCSRCNRMIGFAEEDPDLFARATAYLALHKAPTEATRYAPKRLPGPATGRRNGKYTQPQATPRAERHGMAKLTQEGVDAIFTKRAAGQKLQPIADEAGVSRVQVVRILGLKTSWRPSWTVSN